MIIVNNLKQVMKDKCITQKELADKLGIPKQTMSFIVNNQSSITFDNIVRIAEVLEITDLSQIVYFDLEKE